MQPIERYGLISLLFVIVTVAVILSWDFGGEKAPEREVLAANTAAPSKADSQSRDSRREQADQKGPRSRRYDSEEARATLRTRPKPLRRDEPPVEESAGGPEAEGASQEGTRRPADEPRGRPEEDPARRLESDPSLATNSAADVGAGSEAAIGQEPLPRRSSRAVEKPEPKLYVVQSGDTLSEIALRELGTSRRWQEIVDLNPGLDPAGLRVGARLRLPNGEGVTSTRSEEPAASTPPQTSPRASDTSDLPSYAVREGDNLWKIAARTLGDGERWREIADLNPKLNPDRLFVGQRLVLPAGARVVDTTVATNASSSSRNRRGVR